MGFELVAWDPDLVWCRGYGRAMECPIVRLFAALKLILLAGLAVAFGALLRNRSDTARPPIFTQASANSTLMEATSKADPSKKDYGLVSVVGGSTPLPPDPVTPAPGGVTVAFPGAQGGGAVSVGGRGGTVFEVTNLNDSGTGSLRACISATGPRTCVFKVAGTIYLSSALQVMNPYLTIAGQTAPGGGVQLAGASNRPGNMSLMRVRAHDVVIRYLRFRQNSVPGDLESGGNGSMGLGDNDENSYNTIVDHISASYACGKNFTTWSSGAGPKNWTIQWSILGYPVRCSGGDGGPNTLISSGSNNPSASAYQTDIDVHHNLIHSSQKRMPLVLSKSGRIVNNIIYNWGINSLKAGGGIFVDIIGNYWKPGPMGPEAELEVGLFTGGASAGCGGTTPCHPSAYVSGNKSDWTSLTGAASDAQNWNTIVCETYLQDGSSCIPATTPPDASWHRANPLLETTTWNGSSISQSANSAVAITRTPVESLLSTLIPNAGGAPLEADSVGVSRRVNCAGAWVASGVRDSADLRDLTWTLNGTGLSSTPLAASIPAPPAIPVVSSTCSAGETDNANCACLDSDHDGMPDAWEAARGLNPQGATDGALVQADGYTNLEHYLNGL